ncbi:MAG: hypothetical protein J7K12_02520, partial [Thermoplasmata archaeon]|nr:hypothetical protein [Thermoplasmata archaeon]
DKNSMKENDMQGFTSNFFSSFIHRIIIKMRNYSPVAILDGSYEGRIGEPIIFDASASYDPNGDKLYYRWDFDNDGIYDTPWMMSPEIAHTYHTPYNGFVRLQVSDGKFTDECIARVVIKNAAKGEVDQSQEKADDFVKIYGNKKYAQSFKPSMIGLEGFDILIERKGIASYDNIFSVIGRMLSKIFRFGETNQFFVGDLVVGLYSSLSHSGKIVEKVFSPQDISRSRSWIRIDFETELDPRETYYIVVYQTGGSEWQYYKWYYGSGDPYDRGSSYNYEGTWNEDTRKDFCFKTYGHKTGDEPDGVEERWAVIFGCLDTFMGISYCADADAYDLRDTLVSHGWDPSYIKVVISPTFNDVKNAMEWLASVDDMDDIDLVAIKSHGGKYGFAVKDMAVQYKTAMGPWLDNCGAKGIFIPISTCGSGGAIQFLAKEGRVIMTSCKEDETSHWRKELRNSILFYYLADPSAGALNKKSLDRNNNGWVSAEEAFPYVYDNVVKYTERKYSPQYRQHPQLYDGYAGELDVTKFD